MEYGLPLITNWLKYQEKKLLVSAYKSIEAALDRAVAWIFNKKTCMTLFKSISGLGTLKHRLEVLEAGLTRHLLQLDPANPLVANNAHFQFRLSYNDFIPICFKSKLLAQYEGQKELKWKSFIEKQKLLDIFDVKGTLHKYVNKRCRTASGMDRCIQHDDAETFIKWRSNSLFLNCKCQVCGDMFTRKHLTTCTNLPTLTKRKDNIVQFNMENYNYLDDLLNSKRYDDFMKLFREIRPKLLPGPGIEPPT